MNTDLRLYDAKPGDIRCTPVDLRASLEIIMPQIAGLMRLQGIQTLSAQPTQIGPAVSLDVNFTPIPGDLPPSFLAIQKRTVRILAEYISLFGVTYVGLSLSQEESKITQDTWTAIVKAVSNAPEIVSEVKAPPGVDPDPSVKCLPS